MLRLLNFLAFCDVKRLVRIKHCVKWALLQVKGAKSRTIGKNLAKMFRNVLLKLLYKNIRADTVLQIDRYSAMTFRTFVQTPPIQRFISTWKMVPELGLWDYTAKVPVPF